MVLSVPVGRFMPHKSRKEKIIADLRRKINSRKGRSISSYETQEPVGTKTIDNLTEKKSNIFSFIYKTSDQGRKEDTISSNSLSSINSSDYNYIAFDIRKTFFLTIIVILVELMLYWALEVGGVKI